MGWDFKYTSTICFLPYDLCGYNIGFGVKEEKSHFILEL